MENKTLNNKDFLNEVTKKLVTVARKQEIDNKFFKVKEAK